MKLNDEFINGMDGCTYRCTRTVNANTYEIMMVADKSATMSNLLARQGKASAFNQEGQRIKAAANWFKRILKEKDKS